MRTKGQVGHLASASLVIQKDHNFFYLQCYFPALTFYLFMSEISNNQGELTYFMIEFPQLSCVRNSKDPYPTSYSG